jgi:hypothetical protein
MGTCVAGPDQTCANNFACQDATSCATTCTDITSCVSGNFCDAPNKACCGPLASGDTLSVDSVLGADGACCGLKGNTPCQTITKAMALIDSAQVANVTISVTVNGDVGDWAVSAETYPITLGWGVELSAPGVYFLDDISFNNGNGNNEIFDIAQYSKNDTVGYASIVGAAGSQVGIGMDTSGDQSLDLSSIQVEASQTLYIANASVNGSNFNFTTAIWVQPGGSLVLGQDQSAGNTGTVNIGNALNNAATDGFDGINCQSDFLSIGCNISDATLTGQSSVVIQGQEDVDLLAYDFSTVSLTSAPVIGIKPAAAGFSQCSGKPDGVQNGNFTSVYLSGPVTMTFSNGTVQCLSSTGFLLQGSGVFGNGPPTLTMDSTTIQNTNLGIYASAGTATVTNSTFQFNFGAVQQDQDGNGGNGTIDLSGGGNTVVCSSSVEDAQSTGNEGVDVYNSSTANLAADNVAWDTSGPDYFACTGITSSDTCSCNITTCSNTAPFDGMDAVQNSNFAGNSITTTSNTQSSISCN